MTFGRFSFIWSEIIFFGICISLFYFLKDTKDNIGYDLLFLLWIMGYFIFHSIYSIKVDRYFLAMAPPFTYFIIRAFLAILDRFEFKWRKINLKSTLIPLILILIMLFSINSYLNTIPTENSAVENVIESSNWLKNQDTNYQNKTIYANFFWPHFSWYLETKVNEMPVFYQNESIHFYSLTRYHTIELDEKDTELYSTMLNENNVDYYFSIHPNLNLTSYEKVKSIGYITIYKKSILM